VDGESRHTPAVERQLSCGCKMPTRPLPALCPCRRGHVVALFPPMISLLLLLLDVMWWREHAAQRVSKETLPAPLEAETLLPVGSPMRPSRSDGSLTSTCALADRRAANGGGGSRLEEGSTKLQHTMLRSAYSATHLNVLTIQTPVMSRRREEDEPEDLNTP